MPFNAGTLYIGIQANLATFERDMRRLQQSIRQQGRAFESVGDSITKSLTLPIAAAVGGAVRESVKFESAFAGVRKTVNASEAEFASLRKGILDLSKSMPNSATEIAKVAEAAGQLGIKNEAILGFTKTMVELGTATNLSSEQAADSLARFANITGMSQDQFQNLGAAIVALGNNFAATESEIVEMSKRIASAGTIAKMSEADILAIATTLSSLGVEAEMGGTAISKFIAQIDKSVATGGGSLDQFAKIAGMSAKQFADAWKSAPAESLQAVLAGMKRMQDQGTNLFLVLDALDIKERRESDSVLRLAQGQGMLANALRISRQEWASGAALTKEVTERNKTAAAQFGILLNNVKAMGIAFGDVLVPHLVKFTRQVAEIILKFGNLSASTQEAVGMTLIYVAAIGPLVLWIGKLLSVIGGVIGISRSFVGFLKESAVAMTILTAVTSPFAAAWTFVSTTVSAAIASLSGFFAAGVTLGGVLDAAAAGVVALGGAFFSLPTTLLTVGGAFATLGGAITGIFAAAILSGGDFSLFIKGLGEAAAYVGEQIYNFASDFIRNFGETSREWAAFIGELTIGRDTAVAIFDAIAGALSDLYQNFKANLDAMAEYFDKFLYRINAGFFRLGQILHSPSLMQFAAQAQFGGSADTVKEVVSGAQSIGTAFEGIQVKLDGVTASGAGAKTAFSGVTGELAKTGNTAGLVTPKLEDLLGGAKTKADKAATAIDNMAEKLAKLGETSQVDDIKRQIEKLAEAAGSKADFGDLFSNLGKELADVELAAQKDTLEKASAAQVEKARDTAKKIGVIQAEVYRKEVAEKQLQADKERHQKSVTFFKGLLEDVITGTRFDWKAQFQKLFVDLAAEWATRMIEANALASSSFSEFFGKVIDAITGSFKAVFGDIVSNLGGTVATEAASGAVSSTGGNVVGSIVGGAGGQAATTQAATIFGYQAATVFGVAAAAIFGAYIAKENFDNFKEWDQNTTDEKKVIDVVTAALDAFYPGIGTVINKALGAVGIGEANKLTPNEKSLKSFENWVEGHFEETLGKALNFVLGDMERFAEPGWADKFWADFGDAGGGVFDTLGTLFEKKLGLESGVGQQIGALLAENLAGADLNESLDNIKLFLDAMGISVQQLHDALLETAKAGEISWRQFQLMNDQLAQIPAQGLAGVGDLAGAFEQLGESGGVGYQAIAGVKNIAIEAAEAGITSFQGLQDQLLAAGVDAQDVAALMAGIGAAGITSIEQLGSASDEQLGNIVGFAEAAGFQWDKWKESTDSLTDGVHDLVDAIKALSNAIDSLPDEKTVTIHQDIESEATPNKLGNVVGFASGGVVDRTTFFRTPRGALGMMGEAGPEAILPLKRINGRLGVSAQGYGGGGRVVNINVDATGAEAGVEHRIMSALDSFRVAVVNEAVDRVAYQSRRGVV